MFHTRPINKVTATFEGMVLVLDRLIIYYCLTDSYLSVKIKRNDKLNLS